MFELINKVTGEIVATGQNATIFSDKESPECYIIQNTETGEIISDWPTVDPYDFINQPL